MMKMKKRNKGKKVLTAVSAAVAAGLTPGFIAASAAGSSIQSPSAGTTAAEVVAIDGQTYRFDELYAMQNPDSAGMDTIELNIKLEPDPDVDLSDVRVNAILTTKYGGPRGSFRSSRTIHHEVLEGDTIYRGVDRAPSFPGGNDELMKYINDNIQYPAHAVKNKIQGKVVLELVVKKTGEIGTVKALVSPDQDLEREAVRVCKSLPNFIPARLGGKSVATRHILPVSFTLPEE